jgi:hypothetical protein
MTTPLIRSTMQLVDDPTEMHWFDMTGAFPSRATVEQNPLHISRPPFDKCMVVYSGLASSGKPVEMFMLTAGDDPEEGIVLNVWRTSPGQKPVRLPSFVYVVDGGFVRYGPVDENETVKEADAQTVLGFVSAWYSALSKTCTGYVPFVKPTFTNQRKIAQGKIPAYDWHTVVVKPAQAKAEPQGGTHAPPRLHDRRGHLRRLRSGKNVWVRPCKVGDPSIGAVFKDYEVQT